jgi:two-component system sensor histidine kinase GlrK
VFNRNGGQGIITALVRPKSFMTLILLGFMVVALPLSAGLIFSSFQVGRLARQSQEAVYRSVRATQGGRILVEQVTSMERSARQYLVLKDPARLEAYATTHHQFQDIVDKLYHLHVNDMQRAELKELRQRENAVFQEIKQPPANSQKQRAAVVQFADLAQLARSILAENNRLVSSQVDVMRGMANTAQQLLFWQAVALIPLAMVIGGVFFVLISRPIRQIHGSIHRLGDGNFHVPIAISGPRDLEELGHRLEWLRSRLLELEEQKKRFLRHVSHELKTPLTTVREGSELLAGKMLGPLNAEQLEAVDILRQSSLRLQRLIEDLLVFSRLAEVPSAVGAKRYLRLDRLIESVLADYKLAMHRKQINGDACLQPIAFYGDETKLKTAIDNVVSNAVKYSPQAGTLSLTLAADEETIRIDVIDTGPGISGEDREHVFDPFYQGKVQPAGPVTGTGLGLGIAREAVRAHGGNIEVIEARGGHVRLTLPAALRVPVE